MLTRIVIFLLSLWLPGLLCGQADSTQATKAARKEALKRSTRRYGVSQVAGLYGRVYDERMARRSYRGPGAQLRFGVEQMRPHEREFMLGEVRGFYLTGRNGVEVLDGRLELTYQYQRRLAWARWPAWRWYLGGQAGGLAAGRFNRFLGNSSVSFEWVGYLALSGRVERSVDLPLLGRCTLGGDLALPLLSVVGRLPSYALSGFEEPTHALALVGDFTRVRSGVDLTRPLGAGNQNLFRLRYFWDFYAYRDIDIHRLRHATHGLAVVLLFRQGKVWTEG